MLRESKSIPVSDEALLEFFEETVGILDVMEEACRRFADPEHAAKAVGEVERGLHTIKGNAATFGFAHLAVTAGRVLDWLQKPRGADGGELPGLRESEVLWQFIACARRYINKAREYSENAADTSQMGEEPNPATGTPAAGTGGVQECVPAPAVTPATTDSIAEILAGAPAVTPKLDQLVDMAFRELSEACGMAPPPEGGPEAAGGRRKAAAGQEAPAPAAAAPAAAAPSPRAASPEGAPAGAPELPALDGHALEVGLAAAWLKVAAERARDDAFGRILGSIAKLLLGLQRRLITALELPLAGYIDEALTAIEPLLRSRGPASRWEIEGGNITVARGAGQLCAVILKEALQALASTCMPASAGGLAIRVAARAGEGRIEVEVSGLPEFRGTEAELELFLLAQRVARLGVSIVSGENTASFRMLVPAHLETTRVLIVRSGPQCFAFPWHRVLGQIRRGASLTDGGAGAPRIEYDDKSLPLFTLTGEGTLAAADAAATAGPPHDCIAIIAADGEPVAVTVDQVFHSQELVAAVDTPRELGTPITGLCPGVKGIECVPLIWWPAPAGAASLAAAKGA